MDSLKEFERINELFDLYGELLTDVQKQAMEYYYGYNLSLSEISEELKVSRNAVADAMKKAIAKLEHYEEKLHLKEKYNSLYRAFENYKKEPTKENLKELERMIEDGI